METGKRFDSQLPRHNRVGTLDCLKITGVLQSIYCLCWIIVIGILLIDIKADNRLLMNIGVFSLICSAFNPIGIISFVFNLQAYLVDRKKPEAKAQIGVKAAWIFLWPVITTVFWVFGIVAVVEITGGV